MSTELLKRILMGKPIKTSHAEHEKMPVWKALPILSSDALSSVAYGTEQILLALMAFGAAAYAYASFVALAIILLIGILVISYRQVIEAYPNGGGAYMVTKDNLGSKLSRVTGVSLLVDYTLTVAVSISAGVQAITSAFPQAEAYVVPIALSLVILMTWLNLRGTSESGTVFSIPTYLFLALGTLLIIVGIYKLLTGQFVSLHSNLHMPTAVPGLTLFVLLRTFSSGCSAVTGIEAIADATPHIKSPSVKNGKKTLSMLGILLAFIFGGVTVLSLTLGVSPDPKGTVSVLSMVAADVFGHGVLYYFMQISTMLVLTLAANTSFNGFPILTSIMAQDKNFPRMFANRGDRLSYHYGIISLSLLASILLIVFKGKTDALIPLYAIGVFLSFFIAQGALALKWIREKQEGWRRKSFINGLGSIVSLLVLVIFCFTKFLEGAWIVVALIPIAVYALGSIHNHYESVGDQLRISPNEPFPQKGSIVILPIAGIHKVAAESIAYAKAMTPNVIAFYVGNSEEEIECFQKKWDAWNPGVRLETFHSRYRSVVKPVIKFVERIDYRTREDDWVTVLLPQFIPKKRWQRFLHNQTAARISKLLMNRDDVVISHMPYHLKK